MKKAQEINISLIKEFEKRMCIVNIMIIMLLIWSMMLKNVLLIHLENLTKLLEDAKKPLHPSSKMTKLSFLVSLYNLKARSGWSDIGFTQLVEFLIDIFLEKNNIPLSIYSAKKKKKNYIHIHRVQKQNTCISK